MLRRLWREEAAGGGEIRVLPQTALCSPRRCVGGQRQCRFLGNGKILTSHFAVLILGNRLLMLLARACHDG